ncbi:MAG: putative toxin-antitoxin system toxin component, PIN family [Caldilineaceae bacterium]|nr:putative toxin-antitoxin system toxin component, PIN family [Caldilineaceae bacterium]HRJ42874.1 putative toxin-antitoxin system toxin component, PIN family [Caldilineaceae bacterium]
MERVVLDTNVFISHLLVPSGLPAQIFARWEASHFHLIVSPALLAEVRETLGYARIRRKYPITDEMVDRLIDLLEHDAIVVPGGVDVAGALPADPDDEQILACAVEGRADLIVSGDRHLLALGNFRGIPILLPRDFLARFPD